VLRFVFNDFQYNSLRKRERKRKKEKERKKERKRERERKRKRKRKRKREKKERVYELRMDPVTRVTPATKRPTKIIMSCDAQSSIIALITRPSVAMTRI
jgi:hypothetical protein